MEWRRLAASVVLCNICDAPTTTVGSTLFSLIFFWFRCWLRFWGEEKKEWSRCLADGTGQLEGLASTAESLTTVRRETRTELRLQKQALNLYATTLLISAVYSRIICGEYLARDRRARNTCGWRLACVVCTWEWRPGAAAPRASSIWKGRCRPSSPRQS